MPGSQLLRTLLPDGRPSTSARRKTSTPARTWSVAPGQAALLRPKAVGLATPRLTSSYTGSIDRILFAFPRYAVGAGLAAGYMSVIAALRQGTEFVVVHARSVRPEIDGWFTAAGHSLDKVTFVELPDYVNFTDWAEDGYMSVSDAANGIGYLMEPWEFPRSGDTLIAEAVQSVTGTRTGQAPLIFQGGTGSLAMASGCSAKITLPTASGSTANRAERSGPAGTAPEPFVARSTGSSRERAPPDLVGPTADSAPPLLWHPGGSQYFLDIPSDGAGTSSPSSISTC